MSDGMYGVGEVAASPAPERGTINAAGQVASSDLPESTVPTTEPAPAAPTPITDAITLRVDLDGFKRDLASARGDALEGYRVFKDGNAWCAVGAGFINLQESKAGFGQSPLVALGELIVEEGEIK